MGNWLFLMLLYVLFGWMKKRQQSKAREKIEGQEGWKTGNFVEFGEEILENFLGEDSKDKEGVIEEENHDAQEGGSLDAQLLEKDEKEDFSSNPIFTKEYAENIENEASVKSDHKINRQSTNALVSIIETNNPTKTAIIFREILDKPVALRRKIR